ncbi:MAG: TetR/AcrR family transcriptional regulator [Rubrobacteraceae bacterium]
MAGSKGHGIGRGWSLGHGGGLERREGERSDAARNRGRILRAARRLFGEKGVTRVTMEEVAREAGVGKGTLYRRFPHKGFLCQALLDEPTREFQKETLEIVGGSGRDALAKLDAFLDRLVYFLDDNLDLFYGGHEPLSGAERLAQLSHPAHDWLRSTVLGLLRLAEREGGIKRPLDLEYLATAILAPLETDLYYHQRRVLGYSTGRVSAGVRSLVSAALR